MKRVVCTTICLSLYLVSVTSKTYAQVAQKSHRMDRELVFRYDNDLIFMTDQYYTSGANFTYGKAVNRQGNLYKLFRSKRSDSLKVITHFDYGHQMFTPKEIRKRKVETFDRPYAGWHYVRVRIQNFPSENTLNKFQLELGLVGEASGIGNFHEWWHNALGIVRPKGWDYEIDNEFIINLSYHKIRNWRIIKGVNIITDSGVKFGNGENRISQNVTLQLGKVNRLINSGYTQSRASSDVPLLTSRDSEQEEGYFFYGIKAQQVFSNILIQGSLLGEDSPHIEQTEEFVISRYWGFMYTHYYTSFSFTVVRISPEVVGGNVHRYLSMSLAFRF